MHIDLLTEHPRKIFFRYLGPSISATLVTSIYILADTVMVGRGIGTSALTALNLILPVVLVLYAIGALFGIGGGVMMSVANGSGDVKRAKKFFSTAVFGSCLLSVLIMFIGLSFPNEIARFLGSDENTFSLVIEYQKYVFAACPVFIGSSMLQSFVRNDKGPKRSMAAVLVGAALNIILDYIFIFYYKMGMGGAALATVLGNGLTVLTLLTHFFSKKNTMFFSFRCIAVKEGCMIFYCGISSFLVDAATGITMFFFNQQILRYIGETGIVVYSIISNYTGVANSLFNGVSQAAQPIMASNFGAEKYARVETVRKTASLTAFVVSLLIAAFGFFWPEIIIYLFVEPTEEILALGKWALPVYFVAYFMIGQNMFYNNYFQSVVKPQLSLAIALLRGVFLNNILIFVIPAFLGANSIWGVVPFGELLTFMLVAILVYKEKRAVKIRKSNA